MLYISSMEDIEKSLGVKKKIYSQAGIFLSSLSNEILIVVNKGETIFLDILSDDNNPAKQEKILFKIRNSVDKVFYYKKLLVSLNEIIERDSNKRISYLRCTLYDRYLVMLIKNLKILGYKIILEIPTSTFLNEYLKQRRSGWYKIINFYLYGRKIYQLADLIVSIGEVPAVLKGFEDNKVLVIGNGIILSEIPKTNPPKFEKELHLIGVAAVSYWHGYDRVIKGLSEYYEKKPEKKAYFHIVGNGPDLPKLKELTEKLKLKEYIIFHGPKYGEKLDKIFEGMHVGIAALGHHREKLSTTSELKVREYCARGIPFVFSSYDPDFSNGFPFALKVSSNDAPIDIKKVISFYEELKKNYPDYPLLMRKYAEENLAWEVKLKPVIEKIERF